MNRNWCGKWFRNLFQDETAPFRPNFKDDRFRSEIGSFRVRFNANFCEPISSRLKCFWKVAYRFLWTSRGSLWFYRTSTTQFSTLVLFGSHIGSSSAYLLSKKCDFLWTYLLSAQVFLEGGVSFFMDSNRFFMVLLTVLRLLYNYLMFFPAKPVVHSLFEIIVLVAMWLIFRLWNSQIRLSVQKSCEQLLFQCERSSQVVQRGAAAISEQ